MGEFNRIIAIRAQWYLHLISGPNYGTATTSDTLTRNQRVKLAYRKNNWLQISMESTLAFKMTVVSLCHLIERRQRTQAISAATASRQQVVDTASIQLRVSSALSTDLRQHDLTWPPPPPVNPCTCPLISSLLHHFTSHVLTNVQLSLLKV